MTSRSAHAHLPRSIAAIARVVVAVVALLSSGCFNTFKLDLGALGGPGEMDESAVLGEGAAKLALIDVSGVLSDEVRRGAFGIRSGPSTVVELRQALDRAEDDSDVVGVILRIRTPGGSVVASETLHHEVNRFRERTGQPVIAYLNGLATSGGFYLAMAADRVVSHPQAITGSIGVIMPGLNLAGLMERFGVADQTFTSGPFKDAGSSVRDMTPEEHAQIQGIIDEMYARFVEVVDTGRPDLDRARVGELADGRIFTAGQALEVGLIDEVGYLEDAVVIAEQQARVSSSTLVLYHRENHKAENIYSRTAWPGAPRALLPWPRPDLLAAGFYYLWPAAIPR